VSDFLDLILLAGRLDVEDGGWPIAPLLDALQRRLVRARVLSLSRGASYRNDPRFLECPQLGNRWLQPLLIRRLRKEVDLDNTCLIHVIHDRMIDIGINLAEAWQTPYLQTLEDFGLLARGVKLSRRWFRGLVVSTPELFAELVQELRMPADQIHMIAPGIDAGVSARRSCGVTLPVVGTAGPDGDGSALLLFLDAARRVVDSGRDAEFLIGGQGTTPGISAGSRMHWAWRTA
jgi:hypothetical protein